MNDMRWTITLNPQMSEALEQAIKAYDASEHGSGKEITAALTTAMLMAYASETGKLQIDPADAKVKGDYIEDFEYVTEDGKEVKLPYRVYYIAEGFARGEDGSCAFCEGDLRLSGDSNIARWMRSNEWAETCPVCAGRPT